MFNILEMQIEIKFHFIAFRMTTIKKKQVAAYAGNDVEQEKNSSTISGIAHSYSYYENQCGDSSGRYGNMSTSRSSSTILEHI